MIRSFGMAEPGRRSRPRQPRGERTRRRVLEAALRLLAEGGPAAVTHRTVAAAAGVSLGATTYYFGSKRDLLAEVHRLHLARVRERAEAIFEAFSGAEAELPGGDRRRRAAAVARYLAGGVQEDRASTLATFELALERARDPALRRRLRGPKAESDAYAARMLRAAGSRRPDLDAHLFIAALNGLKLEWLAEGERSAFARRIPDLVRSLTDLFFQDPR